MCSVLLCTPAQPEAIFRRLPVDVRIGKLILIGAIFGVTHDTLTIAATLSTGSIFMRPPQKREQAEEAKRRFACGQSDHLTSLRAYNEWDSLAGHEKFEFCRAHLLGIRTLQAIASLKRQLLELLCEAGFVDTQLHMRAGAVESLGRRVDGSDGVRLALSGEHSAGLTRGCCHHCASVRHRAVDCPLRGLLKVRPRGGRGLASAESAAILEAASSIRGMGEYTVQTAGLSTTR